MNSNISEKNQTLNPADEDLNQRKPNLELKSLLQKAKEQFESDKELKLTSSEPYRMPDINPEKAEKLNPQDQLTLALEIKQYEEEIKKVKEEIKEVKKEEPQLEM